jgi:TonB family protein
MAVTRRWGLGTVSVFIAGVTGCMTPPPRVETPVGPAASQAVAPLAAPPAGQAVAAPDAGATPEANGVKFVPNRIGALRRISGTPPSLPEGLRIAGRTYVVVAKICVSDAGVLDRASIVLSDDPALATSVVDAVKDWRYLPLTVNGGAVPFCYPARFVFKVR